MKEEKQQQEAKEEEWSVAARPTEFQPVVTKGEVVLTELEALVLLLNKVEKITKGLGVK